MAITAFKELFKHFSQCGRVEYICIRPKRLSPVEFTGKVFAVKGVGLEGDRHKSGGVRQVTLIQKEQIDSIASFLGRSTVDPAMLRRNIVVSGINLLSLKEKRFTIGNVVLEYSGECHPCSRMEENLGHGGYNAMRGLGGITAKIIESGDIKVGDQVYALKNS
jgi:MOSC domain-containing protein YiiM